MFWRRKGDIVKAAEKGRLKEIHRILENGKLRPDDRPSDEQLNEALMASILGEHFDCVKALVESGASVDPFSPDAMPPLVAAISRHNDEDLMRFLIEKGADPNLPAFDGMTPLHLAVDIDDETYRYPSPHDAKCVRLSKLLVEAGANINARADDGKTPLDIAAEGGRRPITAELLRSRGAKRGPELQAG
ncbi:MAG: ankyrin repeat domain-containing protein [Planctomycetota bacterium]|jgi:cytochrome c